VQALQPLADEVTQHEQRFPKASPRIRQQPVPAVKPDKWIQGITLATLIPIPFIGAVDISMYGAVLLLLAAFELAIFARNIMRPMSATLAIAITLILAGVYDNSLVGLGASIGAGPLLESLSFVRYFLHTTLVPFLLVPCADLYRRSWRTLAFIAACVLAAVDSAMLFAAGSFWEPRNFAGTLRLHLSRSAENMPFPIVTIGVSLLLVLVGWLIRRKSGDSAVLAGGVAALVGNALPAAQVGTLPGALGEGLLCLSLIVAGRKELLGRRGKEE
jgi:hypothetical protein